MPSAVASRAHGLGLQHDVVEARCIHLLPHLDQVAVGTLHQAVEHLDHVQPRAERGVHRAHLQADDAAADDQHALGAGAQFQRAGGIDDARVVRQEGQAHGLRAGGDDALLEADGLRLAGLVLRRAGGFLHLHMVRIDEAAVAAHHRHLAHLGHRGQAAGELAHHLVLVGQQLGRVDHRRGEADAQVGEMLDLVHHRGDVQQCLAGDAADVEAHPAQRGITFDQHHLQAQVGGAEGGRVAARAGAEHEHVALQVGTAGVAGRRWRGHDRCGSRWCSGGRRRRGGSGRALAFQQQQQ